MDLFEEIEEKMMSLPREDKLELVLDIISVLQGEEYNKVLEEYKKENNYHNPELKKAEGNYEEYEKAYNILCENIY